MGCVFQFPDAILVPHSCRVLDVRHICSLVRCEGGSLDKVRRYEREWTASDTCCSVRVVDDVNDGNDILCVLECNHTFESFVSAFVRNQTEFGALVVVDFNELAVGRIWFK